jgi:hypothetical protein
MLCLKPIQLLIYAEAIARLVESGRPSAALVQRDRLRGRSSGDAISLRRALNETRNCGRRIASPEHLEWRDGYAWNINGTIFRRRVLGCIERILSRGVAAPIAPSASSGGISSFWWSANTVRAIPAQPCLNAEQTIFRRYGTGCARGLDCWRSLPARNARFRGRPMAMTRSGY